MQSPHARCRAASGAIAVDPPYAAANLLRSRALLPQGLRVWKRATYTSLGGVESLVEHRASVEGPGTPARPTCCASPSASRMRRIFLAISTRHFAQGSRSRSPREGRHANVPPRTTGKVHHGSRGPVHDAAEIPTRQPFGRNAVDRDDLVADLQPRIGGGRIGGHAGRP